ncbi:MAG: acyl-CoA thioesterase/bile acid-CoA:amino acid N-acyltransferase family protein [Candidatus Dormibacteria bacterium]
MSGLIRITPDPIPVDGPVQITVQGLAPGSEATIRAQLHDDTGMEWHSWATYQVGPDGTIATKTAAPSAGTYRGSHPDGLLWSMTPASPEAALEHSLKTGLAPTAVMVRVEQAGVEAARADSQLDWLAPGVEAEEVRDNGLFGTAFLPPGNGPFRAVLVFGGSDGGLRLDTAALLASHGFFALAVAYFRYPGLPDELVNIPLEYFDRALQWLHQDPRSEPGRGIGVVGRSRGGELALLLGATFPLIDAVVAYVPSGIVHAGIRAGGPSWQVNVPAWTLGGRPVPFLGHESAKLATEESPEPVVLTPIYCRDMADWEKAADATISIENSHGPVLMLSGAADAMWPSSLLSELAMARIAKLGARHPVRHLAFPGAGHRFVFPTLPGTVTSGRHAADGTVYEYGGEPLANARAASAAHAAMIRWLRGDLSPD